MPNILDRRPLLKDDGFPGTAGTVGARVGGGVNRACFLIKQNGLAAAHLLRVGASDSDLVSTLGKLLESI